MRGTTRTRSREQGQEATTLSLPTRPQDNKEKGLTLVNGSIMTVWITPMFAFGELAGLVHAALSDGAQMQVKRAMAGFRVIEGGKS